MEEIKCKYWSCSARRTKEEWEKLDKCPKCGCSKPDLKPKSFHTEILDGCVMDYYGHIRKK
ncbi:MAG: hypothetical protein ACRDD7_08655 [Peptostreptococcaceae bacterium]